MNEAYQSIDALERARRVEFLLMDCDGVMTAGQILLVPGSQGTTHEYKEFNVQDGVGLSFARRGGLRLGILTGRYSESVQYRAKELGIEILVEGSFEKREAFEKILAEIKVDSANVAYMGDDIQDLPVLLHTGFAIAPANATEEVKKRCHLITSRSGGHGAVREAVEYILRAQGKWEQIVAKYLV